MVLRLQILTQVEYTMNSWITSQKHHLELQYLGDRQVRSRVTLFLGVVASLVMTLTSIRFIHCDPSILIL